MRRRCLAAVNAAAVKPEALSVRILYTEIIACWLRSLMPPPFHGNAFGSFRECDGVQHAPPAKPQRRAFRDLGDDIDRLGLREQAQRTARRFSAVADRFPFGFGGLGVLRGDD